MEHFFKVPVLYGHDTMAFNARLVTFGYSYKFYIIINNKEFEFERDEERNYRVIDTVNISGGQIDYILFESIILALENFQPEKQVC